jgi:ribosomal protein S1
MRDVPETAQEIGKLSPREKKDLTIRIEKRLVGLPVWLLITAVDKKNETFVASRKRALEIMARQAWKKIEEGAIMPATVRELGYKRAVLDLGGVEAIMYASEMSPGFTDAAADVLTIGETYRVKVIHADQEAGTIEVSRKQAMTSPWPGCASRYTKNGVYSGIVSGSIDQGVFINLEPGVDVFTFHPKFKPVYKGDKVKVTIVNVDVDRKRIFARIWGEQRGNASAGARKFGGYSAGIR